jgi:hypothetical protein
MQKGFIFNSLYIALGCAAVVAVVSGYAYIQTKRLEACKSEFQVFKSEVERLGKEAQVKVKQEIERQKKVTNDVSTDYEKRLNYLRDTYNRLRDQRSGQSGLPPIPNAPRSIDEVSTDSIPLAGICAATTQQFPGAGGFGTHAMGGGYNTWGDAGRMGMVRVIYK